MIKLTIDNSYSRIEGLSVKQDKDLRKAMSYSIDPQAAYFGAGGFKGNTRCLMNKRGEFPTGLLYIVRECLLIGSTNSKDSEVNDLRRLPKTTHRRFAGHFEHTPYPEQDYAAMVCQMFDRGIVVAPTGTGKSVIAALIVEKMQLRALVVVPSLELKRQLTKTFKGIFGATKVGDISSNRDLVVENVDALDPNKVLEGYDVVIIDEFHHAAAKTYRNLNKKAWTKVFHRFGLTATPFRSQDNERLLLESVLSEVIYSIDYDLAVARGYIVPMEAYYIDLPKRQVKGETWAQVYSEIVVNNGPRNEILRDLLLKLHAQDISTLCLVKEIRHGELLSALTGGAFANGQDGDSAMLIDGFNSGRLTTLIGTTGVLGEGVDTKPTEYVIIAGLGKSRNQFMQSVGRTFRKFLNKESCKIIIFRDPSHKWSLAHFREQCKILKEEYGVIPVKLDI